MSPLKSVFLRHFNYRIQFRGEFSTSIWLRPDRIYNELRPQTIILWQSPKPRKKSRNRKVFPISCLSVQRAMMWLHCSASDISRKCPQKSVGDTQGQRAPRLLKRNLPKSQHNGAKIGPNLTTFSEEKNWTKSFCLNKYPESQLKPNWGWKRRKYICALFSIDEN